MIQVIFIAGLTLFLACGVSALMARPTRSETASLHDWLDANPQT